MLTFIAEPEKQRTYHGEKTLIWSQLGKIKRILRAKGAAPGEKIAGVEPASRGLVWSRTFSRFNRILTAPYGLYGDAGNQTRIGPAWRLSQTQ
jgi:hypothetical protein